MRSLERLASRLRSLYPYAFFHHQEFGPVVRAFQIGTESGDYVAVDIRERPDEHDDWLDATIAVSAGAFAGKYRAMLVTSDFPRFRAELERLYASLDGAARFQTVEGQLELTCTGNGIGGITVEGRSQDFVGVGNVLQFRLEIDQTFLPDIVAQIRELETQHPHRLP